MLKFFFLSVVLYGLSQNLTFIKEFKNFRWRLYKLFKKGQQVRYRTDIQRLQIQHNNPVNAIIVTAEYAPIWKQGGLGEAVAGLAEGLCKTTAVNIVRVIFPYYSNLDHAINHQELVEHSQYQFDIEGHSFAVFSITINKVQCYLIKEAGNTTNENSYFKMGQEQDGSYSIYSPTEYSTLERFAHFSKAATILIQKMCEEQLHLNGQKIDLIHLHDWHTIPIARLIHPYTSKNGPKIIFTFHSNDRGAQGRPSAKRPIEHEKLKEVLPDFPCENLVLECLPYVDHVSTVSYNYSQEVLTRPFGFQIEKEMQKIASENRLTGILNGFRNEIWNPQTCRQLKEWIDPLSQTNLDLTYSAYDFVPEKKRLAKEQLARWIAVSHKSDLQLDLNKPLFCFVGRYSEQKGITYFQTIMETIVKSGGQLIFVGSQELFFMRLILNKLEKFRNANQIIKDNTWIIRDQRDQMTQRFIIQEGRNKEVPPHEQGIGFVIRAAADFVIIPSSFEPCGLVQFEAWSFGSLVVGTATGGLADTINEDPKNLNGFKFEREYIWESFSQKRNIQKALKKAIHFYYSTCQKSEQYNSMLQNIMKHVAQYDWNKHLSTNQPSATENYLTLYRSF
jgi:starch synthase